MSALAKQMDSTFPKPVIEQESLEQIFLNARTQQHWTDSPVPEQIIRKIYDVLKMGPTSANCCPGRFFFVTSQDAKQKLSDCAMDNNKQKILVAPVTVIIGYDLKFYDFLPKLFPHTDARSWYAGNEKFAEETAFRNSTLQGAYFIIATRALGYDCGPMSGFDNKKVDEAFFAGTNIKSNFICSIGLGDETKLYPRGPRLEFEESCKIL